MEGNTGRPNVGVLCVWFASDHLRRRVRWGSAGGDELKVRGSGLIAQTKVNHTNVVLSVEKKILGFHVAVANVRLSVKILENTDQL
jgi:hypothetical protein